MKQETPFPARMTLNGADFFLLQLDHIMWKLSRQRNVCTFVVTLQDRLEYADLAQLLKVNEAYQWLCRLRLHKGLPFSLAKWVFKPSLELPVINQYQQQEQDKLPAEIWQTPFDIGQQSAFRVSLIQLEQGGTQLVFAWHHALMDAHGGEIFVRHLGGSQDLAADWIVSGQKTMRPLRERADIALQMKGFLCDVSRIPFKSLTRRGRETQNVYYRNLNFSAQQTAQIAERAATHGAGFLLSAFYLAACANAVAKVNGEGVSAKGDMLIPVPLDQRKRGVQSPVLGNQVSFLFYRIPEQALFSVSASVNALIEQMKSLMRSENPGHFLVMLDFLRRVPAWLYRMQLSSPSNGEMASFYYSDTGDSLNEYEQLFARTVSSAVHYPPNMYPPGVTFVFSRFQGSLQLTLGYMESVLEPHEVEKLLAEIQHVLLGTDSV